MSIIAVLNSKGGSGKSTVATNLARGLQLSGYKTLLVDSDPQGTARDWRGMDTSADMPAVVGVDRAKAFEENVREIAGGYEVTVIDGAARLHKIMTRAVKAADLVLIPVQPSAADLWATEDLVELIRTRQEITGGRPAAAFVVSRQVVGTNLAGEVGDVLDTYGLPVLEGRTSQRVAYTEALNTGVSVQEITGADKAADEVRTITLEVIQWLKDH